MTAFVDASEPWREDFMQEATPSSYQLNNQDTTVVVVGADSGNGSESPAAPSPVDPSDPSAVSSNRPLSKRLSTATDKPSSSSSSKKAKRGQSEDAAQVAAGKKKRKATQACDACAYSHQPCDNAQPKCARCTRLAKDCLYTREQKRRGPPSGYIAHAAESEATWGLAMTLLPGLQDQVEAALASADGQQRLAALKHPDQKTHYVSLWKDSRLCATMRRTMAAAPVTPVVRRAPARDMTHDGSALPYHQLMSDGYAAFDALLPADDGHVSSQGPPMVQVNANLAPPSHQPASYLSPTPFNGSGTSSHFPHQSLHEGAGFIPSHTSQWPTDFLDDLVERDITRSAQAYSQTLRPLGFAPHETIEDYRAISSNPEPLDEPTDEDIALASEEDQNAWCKLIAPQQYK